MIFQSHRLLLLLLFLGKFSSLHLLNVFQRGIASFPFDLLKILILSLDDFSDFFIREKTSSIRNEAEVKNMVFQEVKKNKKD
jgi:hypothetical protein